MLDLRRDCASFGGSETHADRVAFLTEHQPQAAIAVGSFLGFETGPVGRQRDLAGSPLGIDPLELDVVSVEPQALLRWTGAAENVQGDIKAANVEHAEDQHGPCAEHGKAQ